MRPLRKHEVKEEKNYKPLETAIKVSIKQRAYINNRRNKGLYIHFFQPYPLYYYFF